jgi:hypothetical protein
MGPCRIESFPDSMVQFDPTATGRGFPGYRIPDELPPQTSLHNRRGRHGNGGPDTGEASSSSSSDDIDLDPNHTVLAVIGASTPWSHRRDTGRGESPDPGASAPLETLYIDSIAISR